MISISAPAKVNLYLHVGPARADGRHPLDSLVVFADRSAADRLSFVPGEAGLRFSVTGPNASHPLLGASEDNLIVRAVRLFEAWSDRNVDGQLQLEKHLPIAAGIGGGSADAAATLRLLCAAYDIGEDVPEDLMQASVPLGGDVPACLAGAPVLMRGDGDRVEPLAETTTPLHAVLANSGLQCPTGPVFKAFDAQSDIPEFREVSPPGASELGGFVQALQTDYRNDLQAPAISLVPEIADLLLELKNTGRPMFSAMSGSGATCFAIYEDALAAQSAAAGLKTHHPDWWVVSTVLGRAGFDLTRQAE